ncbi:MAG: cyclophilin family peptidyl-prolyl cis-trans isomerase [Bacteroidia bacterium]|jgi:cyclophilin family peptidyl-prolyl cis-trans isomerase
MKNAIILLLLIAACGPKNEGPNKFSDEKLINIYELQDRRDTKALLPLLKAKKESHRIAAAMAFASIQDTIAIPYLNQMLQIDQDPMPRRAAAYALGQIGSTKARGILIKAFDQELFPANRRYVMEAIGKCGDSSTIKLFEENEYQDSALQMGWAYGVFRLSQKGFTSDVLNKRMMKLVNNDNKDLAILASHYVYRDLRNSKNSELVDSLIGVSRYAEVKERFGLISSEKIKAESLKWSDFDSMDNYQKIELINSKNSWSWEEHQDLHFIFCDSTLHIGVRGAAFTKIFPRSHGDSQGSYLESALSSGDMALQSIAAIELQKGGLNFYNPHYLTLLNTIKTQLKLPQQAETYIDICKAIEALGGEKFEGYKPPYNHPIDWEFVKTIPADQQVLIKTNKGEITLQLFIEDAPGTTSNFLKLVDSSFYDGKFFHRVVPQFVVQGGCPRGDGWGSLDWTQRSEFSNYQTYEPGTVGVASAGKDTEGVQFFITHCPTPHLDGRYSIFARVVSGMNVVNKMEVGDRMIRVTRK